jgi:hypothetical protein
MTPKGVEHVNQQDQAMTVHAKPWVVAAVWGVALAGCGGEEAVDNLPRQAVSGSVTLDGKPLASGSIQFVPAGAAEGSAGGVGVTAGAKIENGRYEIDRGHGPVPGTYKVAINSAPVTPTEPAKDTSVSPGGRRDAKARAKEMPKETLPAKYNSKTTLEAQVKEGGSNTFDFPMKSE